jgi:DNA modification methylase
VSNVTAPKTALHPYFATSLGSIYWGDSLEILADLGPSSVNLIMTSPPFGLVRKKDYGNADAHEYLDWFRPFAEQLHRVLNDRGSLVIDIGGAWNKGVPTRSLYHFKLLIMLCEEYNFHLAQEFYWWNPSRLPSPAEWVTVRRIRAKDAVNTVWWLSKTSWPKASNRRVLQPYSNSMRSLLKSGYRAKLRPSGHDISDKFSRNNGAAIPPNLIAIPNTESNSYYLRYCNENGLKPHPARYPPDLPEFFIRMLTDRGDLVVDPFGGSCVTGEVSERLGRRWVCSDLVEDYLKGAVGRFHRNGNSRAEDVAAEELLFEADVVHVDLSEDANHYKVARPGLLWNHDEGVPLPADGGERRQLAAKPKVESEGD